MARTRGDGPITLSILDRLIDEDPKQSVELPLTRSESLREFKKAVRRDLEWLLNTRQTAGLSPNGSQLQNSLYTFGLPDIASMGMTSIKDRQRLMQAIEAAVARFEPRIANVRVRLVDASAEKSANLRFVIEGLLRLGPSPEPVSFDTVLELSSGEYKLPGES